MNAALREAMQAQDGAGDLTGAGVKTGEAEHPVCGDLVRIQVRLDDDGAIADLAWRADGCPATLAVASIARATLVGHRPDRAEHALRRRLGELGGLARHETHAQAMLLRALAAAVDGAGEHA